MLPVIHAGSFFAYLAYEGTQFGAEKMVLFSQRESTTIFSWGHSVSLNKFKKTEIMSNIFLTTEVSQ